jgi:pterin-4a-carbinolamine dehydratase
MYKTFNFDSYHQAWDFMSLVAKAAEKHQQHPEWHLKNNYVEVKLQNRLDGGISEGCLYMASFMDKAESHVHHEQDF